MCSQGQREQFCSRLTGPHESYNVHGHAEEYTREDRFIFPYSGVRCARYSNPTLGHPSRRNGRGAASKARLGRAEVTTLTGSTASVRVRNHSGIIGTLRASFVITKRVRAGQPPEGIEHRAGSPAQAIIGQLRPPFLGVPFSVYPFSKRRNPNPVFIRCGIGTESGFLQLAMRINL
jgi:hypothetical protein